MTDAAAVQIARKCPECGSEAFDETGPRIKCAGCGNAERHRATRLMIDEVLKPQKGWRILHIAPEVPLAKHLIDIVGDGYEPVDFNPRKYVKYGLTVERIDLCTDAANLEAEAYDLIIHNHVLEHVPCNWSTVLLNLQRAVKPGGAQMFSFPVAGGYFREDLDPDMDQEARKAAFGQYNHMRRFGRKDFNSTIGAVFPGITRHYTMTKYLKEDRLLAAAIPEKLWKCSSATVFMARK